MLVLSRRVGEAIVIDRQIDMTLLLIAPEFAEFSIGDRRTSSVHTITVDKIDKALIQRDVFAILVNVENDKVRIGLEYPLHICIERKEHSNV